MLKLQRMLALSATALLAGAMLPTPAWAQNDEGSDEPESTPTPEAEPASSDDNGSAPFSRVIDDEETIFAVQRKAYLTAGEWEFGIMYNLLLGDRFVATGELFELDDDTSLLPLGGAGTVVWHISEQLGIELFGGYFNPTESETTKELLSQRGLVTENARLTQLLWAAGLGIQWSPIYGKLQLFDLQLGNFDFYFGAGFAVGQTRVRCIPGRQLDPVRFPDDQCEGETADVGQQAELVIVYEPETFRPMGTFSVGFRFRFNELVALRAEVRDYIFTSQVYRPEEGTQFSDSVRNNLYLQVGVSVFAFGDNN